MESGESVEKKAIQLSLPLAFKTTYQAMYAYGNHIHVKSAEVNLVIMDFGVATTFTTMCKPSGCTRQQSNQSILGIRWMG